MAEQETVETGSEVQSEVTQDRAKISGDNLDKSNLEVTQSENVSDVDEPKQRQM